MVHYRLATEEDYPQINDFFNRIHRTHRKLEQFRWEFHDGPFGPSVYVIAVAEDRIVGTNCVIPIEFTDAGGQVVRSGKSEDTLVDPDYRGQNIFYNIYEYLFERSREHGIQVIWGFTSAKKPFAKMGFSIPYEHQQNLIVSRIRPAYRYLSSLNDKNRLADKLKIWALCAMARSRSFGKTDAALLKPYRITTAETITEGVDELIRSDLQTVPASFAIRQHPGFQAWRVYDNPNFRNVSTFGFYAEDNTLKALLVFNARTSTVAYVVQSTFAPDLSEKEIVAMIRYATRQLFRQGIALIRNWQFDTNVLNRQEMAWFSAAGYTPLKRGIGFVWKVLDDKLTLQPELFYLSRIATQGVM